MTTAQAMTKTSRTPLRVKGCCNPVAPPLPDAQADEFAATYKALGDATRIQMLHILATASEPVCVCDFTAAFDLGQPTISHHLATLRDAGIVTSFKRGIWAFYQLNPTMPDAARAVVAQVS
jgi:ArsR family transcriptional regulator, arsenate/arsenite/antimonite-responsive transcriptional repressor